MVVVVVELEVIRWEVILRAPFVFAVVLSVVLVVSRKMMMKKNLKKKKKSLQECLGLVVLLLALHEHESAGPVFEIRMSQAPFPVVEYCQTHPLAVVRQLAYVWQSFLQRLSVYHLSPHIWIQTGCYS